jgi:hypothetical protein
MLPGFTASSSLYRSSHAYAGPRLLAAGGATWPTANDAVIPASVIELGPGFYCRTSGPFGMFLQCWAVCPPGTEQCGSFPGIPWWPNCVDTQADPNNCGGCGKVCGPKQACNNGVCGSLDCCPNACPTCQCGPSPNDTDGVPCCGATGSYCCPSGYKVSTTRSCSCAKNGHEIPMGCCTSCSG